MESYRISHGKTQGHVFWLLKTFKCPEQEPGWAGISIPASSSVFLGKLAYWARKSRYDCQNFIGECLLKIHESSTWLSQPHKNPQMPECLCLISLMVRCGERRTTRGYLQDGRWGDRGRGRNHMQVLWKQFWVPLGSLRPTGKILRLSPTKSYGMGLRKDYTRVTLFLRNLWAWLL